MLGVIEESQANTEIMGRYEAHENFGCYAKAISKNKHRNNAPATTAIGHQQTLDDSQSNFPTVHATLAEPSWFESSSR